MKEISLLNIVNISWAIQEDVNYLTVFKHKDSSFFKRHSKVIQWCWNNKMVCIEF